MSYNENKNVNKEFKNTLFTRIQLLLKHDGAARFAKKGSIVSKNPFSVIASISGNII